MTPHPTMTVVVASHERREPLRRLIRALAAELECDPLQRVGVDVVVVLDGSTDGSAEMLAAEAFPVPLHTIARAERRGLATTRNDGLAAARGHLVWFLDDDLVPSSDLIARHRSGHLDGVQRIVVGPCPVPLDAPTLGRVKQFWGERYAELHASASGTIDRFDHFSAANTSGPAEVFRRVGGFNADFVGYGMEDYELACRLLEAGIPLMYDAEAVALHPQRRTVAELCAAKREEGRNAMRLIRLHPHTTDALVPEQAPRTSRLIGMLTRGSPRALARLARIVTALATAETRLLPAAHGRVLTAALLTSFAAGVADVDGDGRLVARLLGLG
jgi:GT2 family glycosyltransferase